MVKRPRNPIRNRLGEAVEMLWLVWALVGIFTAPLMLLLLDLWPCLQRLARKWKKGKEP